MKHISIFIIFLYFTSLTITANSNEYSLQKLEDFYKKHYSTTDVKKLDTIFPGQGLPHFFSDEKEAISAGCEIGFLKSLTQKSCVLNRFQSNGSNDILLIIVYDLDDSGKFVRRNAFSRYTKYRKANISLKQAFKNGLFLIAVEYETGSGTGYLSTRYELIGWKMSKFVTVFQKVNYCHKLYLGNEIHIKVKPSFFIPESQHKKRMSLLFNEMYPKHYGTWLLLEYQYELLLLTYKSHIGHPPNKDQIAIPDATFSGKWTELYKWDINSFSFIQEELGYHKEHENFFLGLIEHCY